VKYAGLIRKKLARAAMVAAEGFVRLPERS